MTEEARTAILKQAIETYGREAQRDMMIEEMAELTKALLKERRAAPLPVSELEIAVQNILEEMADVQIVLDQMKLIYGDATDIEEKKLRRLFYRMSKQERAPCIIMAGDEKVMLCSEREVGLSRSSRWWNSGPMFRTDSTKGGNSHE